MALSRKLMIEGESIVLEMRTHIKVLFVAITVFILTCGIAGYLLAVTSDRDGIVRTVIIAAAVIVIVIFSLYPFVQWLTSTYTITNKRIVEQTGLLTRSGRIIPLSRVNDVAYEKQVLDRILGCGTLIIHDASEQSGLRLHDVPKVEDVHRTLTTLVFQAHGNAGADEKI